MRGILYIVATPIGNLGDITYRAVEVLKSVQVIACEDTRHTEKLMHHLGFFKPLHRYDEHTHARSAEKILGYLSNGQSVALVTDAGTPAISDPGNRLVREVVKANFSVIPIPGPSSVMAALSASGLCDTGFVFFGFLPRRNGRARRLLQEGSGLGRTMVVFESPFRVESTLEWIAEMMPEAEIVVARELTKIHEEFIRGNPAEVLLALKSRPKKGEFVLLIRPVSDDASDSAKDDEIEQ